MEDADTYEKLKKNLNDLISPMDVHRLKNKFSDQINSKRELDAITTASDLFTVLENRDVLSMIDISCLDEVSSILNHAEINSLVHMYKKLCYSGHGLCLCGENIHSIPQAAFFQNDHAEKDDCAISKEKRRKEIELNQAIANICEHIGEMWSVLARELDLTERDISEIRKLSEDYKLQAFNALLLWKRKADSEATVAMLDMALKSRLCMRKGLGPHLLTMKPIRVGDLAQKY